MIFDGLNNFWYNAEGQLCAVAQSGGITAYSYETGAPNDRSSSLGWEVEGRRVAKGTLSSRCPLDPDGNTTMTCISDTDSALALALFGYQTAEGWEDEFPGRLFVTD